jgi:nucleoid DNA-binding protein
MPNTTKKSIVSAIVQKTGVKPAEAKRALETVLRSIKLALADGRQVDLGKKLGKLKVVTRNLTRRINRNLNNVVPTIENVHKKHPKTVRLLGGKDLSENPQPTIVHKVPEPPAKKSFAIALPAWRRRIK